MNGVLVKMSNGDNESFKTATRFESHYEIYDGASPESSKWLRVFQGELELGVFPPGSWQGVRYFEGYAPPKPGDLCADPDWNCGSGPGHVHVHKDWPGTA